MMYATGGHHAERRIPTRQEVLAYLHERRNWGRWRKDDQVGAINLITPEKRIQAAALVVYSGREALQAAHPDQYYGVPFGTPNPERPGLHASCLPFLRDHDIAVLVWDMMDYMPNGYDIPWSVHGAIFAYGIALLDNALLQPLAEVCTQEGRYEFMLIIAPLKVVR